MRKKILFSGISILLILVTTLFTKLNAQETNRGLTIIPPSFELDGQPDKTITKTITLENHTGNTVTIRTDQRNFTAQGEEGNVALTEEDTPYALAKWITVTPEKATLAAEEKMTFTFTVTVPKNAEPGGHFGSLVFATVPNKELNQSGALLSQEIGSLLLVKIAGKATEKASLLSFTADKQFSEYGPISFTTRVKNEGNVHIKPVGTITVTDMFGKTQTIPVEPRNILPNAVRKIPAVLEEKILIGKYTAEVSLTYGASGKSIQSTTTFYAFPVTYAVIGVIILAVLFLLRNRLTKAGRALIGR